MQNLSQKKNVKNPKATLFAFLLGLVLAQTLGFQFWLPTFSAFLIYLIFRKKDVRKIHPESIKLGISLLIGHSIWIVSEILKSSEIGSFLFVDLLGMLLGAAALYRYPKSKVLAVILSLLQMAAALFQFRSSLGSPWQDRTLMCHWLLQTAFLLTMIYFLLHLQNKSSADSQSQHKSA